MRFYPSLLVLLAFVCVAGCEKEDAIVDPDPDDEVTFSQVQAIFNASCAVSGCHAGASPQQGMNLSAGVAYANIVNVASVQNPALSRITPDDPDNSYLFRKISGTNITGSRMPLGGTLSAAQIDLVRDWIEAGAPNN